MSHVVAGSAITRQTMPEYRGFIAQCMMPRGDAIPLLMDEMLAIRKSWTMVSKYDFQCFFFERLMDIFPDSARIFSASNLRDDFICPLITLLIDYRDDSYARLKDMISYFLKCGVPPCYFSYLGDIIVYALRRAFGSDFSDILSKSWCKWYRLGVVTIIPIIIAQYLD